MVEGKFDSTKFPIALRVRPWRPIQTVLTHQIPQPCISGQPYPPLSDQSPAWSIGPLKGAKQPSLRCVHQGRRGLPVWIRAAAFLGRMVGIRPATFWGGRKERTNVPGGMGMAGLLFSGGIFLVWGYFLGLVRFWCVIVYEFEDNKYPVILRIWVNVLTIKNDIIGVLQLRTTNELYKFNSHENL